MKQEKHGRKVYKIIEKYSVLLFIAALFMSVGYAAISGDVLTVHGEASAEAQEGVFITDVVYVSNNGASIANSKINNFIGAVLDSQVTLGDANSSITYRIHLYNNTDKEQLFIDALVDATLPNTYTNKNIEFVLDGIESYSTTILPNSSLDFTITFKFKKNADITEKTLKSILNFRFLENPILTLTNENETYLLNGIYPDYTPKEYEFYVSNYNVRGTNNVSMEYDFDISIPSPLKAEIYDASGKKVTSPVNISGDGVTDESHKYTLKIIWDNSNPENNIAYDSIDYINKDFNCNVKLSATPNGDNSNKYTGYTIIKEFDVDIKSTNFQFDVELSAAAVNIVNDVGSLNLTLKNNTSNSNYTDADITYEIELLTTKKYTLETQDTNNGILSGGSASQNTVTLTFEKIANVFAYATDEMTVIITTSKPFKTEIRKTVTLNYANANTVFGFRSLRIMTQADCEGWWNSDTYNNLCGGNNGQFEFTEEGALVLDEDNMVSYTNPSDVNIFSEGYGICFTMKADVMQGDRFASTIISIGEGNSEYLSWVGIYKGYLHVFAYREGNAGADFAQATTEAGFISYDIKKYNNTIVNIQISARRAGSMALWINGERVASCNTGRVAVPAKYIAIGDLRPLRGLKFHGILYDIEIYKQLLNDDRVLANYEYAKKTWIDNQ